MADDRPEDHSDIEPISLPPNGFQSRIPAYLLEGKSDSEQYVLNEVSKMGHFIEWSAPILLSSNVEARRTNGRVKTLWALKELFTGVRGIIIGTLGFIGSLAGVFELIKLVKELLPH